MEIKFIRTPPRRPRHLTPLEQVVIRLNKAAGSSDFFQVDAKRNEIVFGAFANNFYFRALAAFLLINENLVYFASGYEPKQRIVLRTSAFGWDDVLNRLDAVGGIKDITITIE